MSSSSSISVPAVVGSPQALVDNNQLTTSAGIVQRQVITNADPSTPGNYQSTDNNGNSQIKFGPGLTALLSSAPINFSGSGPNPLIAGVSGKIIRVYRMLSVVASQTNLTFQDGSTSLSGPIPCWQGGGISLDYSGEPWYVSSAGNALNLNSTNAVAVAGTIWYIQE